MDEPSARAGHASSASYPLRVDDKAVATGGDITLLPTMEVPEPNDQEQSGTPDEARNGSEDETWSEDDDDDASNGSMSVAPSIFCHESAHGRQYHRFRSGRYPLPNDDEEMAREQLRHHILQEVLGGRLFLADIGENPQKIIDLGTGSGVWVIDVAEQFPGAQVIGTDLSPVQPTWVPINARMLLDDMDEPEWMHGSGYDLVHMRDMKCAIRDMDEVLVQIYSNLRVGGWVEFQDFLPFFYCADDSIREGSPLAAYAELTVRGMREFDCHWFDKEPSDVEEALGRAGFADVRSVTYDVPIGRWMPDPAARDVGSLVQFYVADTCDVFGAKPLAALGLTDDERARLVGDAKDCLREWNTQRYLKLSVCYARKGPPA